MFSSNSLILDKDEMCLEATNCAIGAWEDVIMEKLAPKRGYVESKVVKNHTIVFYYTDTSLLEQTIKKMRRERKHHPSQNCSKQRVMKDLIQ